MIGNCLSIAIDFGAAATVIPHTLVIEYPIMATAMSEAGVCYVSATGEPIPKLGEQRPPLASGSVVEGHDIPSSTNLETAWDRKTDVQIGSPCGV